jgi:hypothetical protein
MPDGPWRVKRGQMETCTVCNVSFSVAPGLSTSALVHQYTDWREAHAHPDYVPPEAPVVPGPVSQTPTPERSESDGDPTEP